MDEINWPLILGVGIIASASPDPAPPRIAGTSMRHGRRAGLSLSASIMAGLALHIKNPKPILFFGTLFSIGVPAGTSAGELALVVIIIGWNNAAVFFAYAVLFYNGAMARAYAQARHWFECVFAALFGLTGVQILTMRLTQ